jgi:hypothetical protein
VIKGKLGFQVAYGHDKLERNFRDFQKRLAAMRFTRSTSTAFKCLPFCPPISRPSFYFVVLMYMPGMLVTGFSSLQYMLRICIKPTHASKVQKCSARVRRANDVTDIPQTNGDNRWGIFARLIKLWIRTGTSMIAMFVINVFTV